MAPGTLTPAILWTLTQLGWSSPAEVVEELPLESTEHVVRTILARHRHHGLCRRRKRKGRVRYAISDGGLRYLKYLYGRLPEHVEDLES